MATPEELKQAQEMLDAAVSKKLDQTEGKIKEQAGQIASLLENLDATKKALAETERKFLKERQVAAGSDEVVLIRGNPNIKEGAGDAAPLYMKRDTAHAFGLLALAIAGTNEKQPGYISESARKSLDKLYGQFGIEKAQTVGDDTAGGITVPDVLYREVIRLVLAYGVARRAARWVPLSSGGQNIWPKRLSGLTVYAPGEGGTLTASQMGFGNITLIPKKWATLSAISSELNEDSLVDIGALLAEEIALAFATKEDDCLFNGDGTSTYFGIKGLLSSAAAGSASAITGSTTWTSGTAAELAAFPGMIADYADVQNDLGWFINRNGYYQLMVRLALASGGVTAEEARMTAFGSQRRYLGYPVEFTNALQRVPTSTAKVGVFGNLRMATLCGDRRKLDVVRSSEVYFASDLIGIKATQRLDMNVHDVGTSTTAGAYTVIKMAS